MSPIKLPNSTLHTSYFILQTSYPRICLDLGMFTDRYTLQTFKGDVWKFVVRLTFQDFQVSVHLRTCCSFPARPPETPNPRSAYSQIRAVLVMDMFIIFQSLTSSKSFLINNFMIYSLINFPCFTTCLSKFSFMNGGT